MIDYKIEMDKNLAKWLRSGVTPAVTRSLVKSAKETRASTAVYTAREIKSRKLYQSSKVSDIKKHIFFNPKNIPKPSGDDFIFSLGFSRRRLNLYKIPYKMKRVSFKKKIAGGKKTKTIRMNQIMTKVFGKPYEVDPLKPFFIVSGGNKGKYFYKGKPKASEKPIAIYRKGENRRPTKQALAPSLARMIEKTPGLFNEIHHFAEWKYSDRVQRNVGYFIDQITD